MRVVRAPLWCGPLGCSLCCLCLNPALVIVLLLTVGDNNLIRQMVTAKGFLNGIFPGLLHDKAAVLVLILETMHSKILTNPVIVKTNRIRLFNDFTMKYVLMLCNWRGPLKVKVAVKRKLGDCGESQPLETKEEDIVAVRDVAFKVLTTLCCSFKYGIIFRDLSYGTAGWNQNHIITNLLKTCPNPYASSHTSKLFAEILKACPDQMKHCLSEWKDILVPRLSTPWLQAVNFLVQIVQSQDCIACLFESDDKKPVSKLVAIAKMICLPDVISCSQIEESLKSGHFVICYYLFEYMSSILKQVKSIVDYCRNPISSTCKYSNAELDEFRNKFLSAVRSAIPNIKSVEAYWARISSGEVTDLDEETKQNIQGFEIPNVKSLLSQVLDTFTFFYDVWEESLESFEDVLNGLNRLKQNHPDEDVSLLYLKFIDLFAKSSSSVMSSESSETSPLTFLLEFYVSVHDEKMISRIEAIVFKLLKNSCSYDGKPWEISIWLQEMKLQKKHHSTMVQRFFIYVINSMTHSIKENYKTQMEVDNEGILCHSNDKETSNSRNFSNLVPFSLKKASSVKDKAITWYMQSVIRHIFHRQFNPQILFSLLSKYENLFSKRNLNYWSFLTNTSGNIQVEELLSSNISEQFQDAFMSFHSHSTNEQKEDLAVFNHFIEDVDNLLPYDMSGLLWQLLTYIKIDADQVFLPKKKGMTAIPNYVACLQCMLAIHAKLLEDIKTKPSNIDNDYDDHNMFLSDLIQHPSIKSYFLPCSSQFSELDSDAILIIESLSHLVFDVLRTKLLIEQKDLLEPLKNSAVIFCETFIHPKLSDEEYKSFKWSVFEKTIMEFSSLFTADDVLSLVKCMLSLDETMFYELDPKCCTLSMLLQTAFQCLEDSVMSKKLFRNIFKRTFSLGNRKKKKRFAMLRETVLKFLKCNSKYSSFVTDEMALSVLEQQSTSSLAIIDELIATNSSVCNCIQTSVMSLIISGDILHEEFLFHVAVKCLTKKGDLQIDDSNDFLQSVSNFIWTYLCRLLVLESSSELHESLDDSLQVISLMKDQKIINRSMIQDVLKQLRQKSLSEIPHQSKMQMLIQVLGSLTGVSESSEVAPPLKLINILINWIEHGLQNTNFDDSSTSFSLLLKFLQLSIKNVESTALQQVFEDPTRWHALVQKILKIALRNVTVSALLISILNSLIEKQYEVIEEKNSTDQMEDLIKIHSLLSSHSNFCRVLLDESGEYKEVKDCVVQLLVTLVRLNRNICNVSHVPVYLSAYHATLNDTDQKLLYLLKLYEDSGVNMLKFCPFLWGPPAISHYTLQKNFVWKSPKMVEVVALFQADISNNTALNFPLHVKLEPVPTELPNSNINWNKVYDPRFTLPIYSIILEDGAFLHCKTFIESNALSVIFASLSSFDADIRALGYCCLTRFYNHLKCSTFNHRLIWLSLLDSVRNSIETVNQRLSCIITLFLGKCVNILIKPDNLMYMPICNFLMVKPNLDLTQVPEFYKLFNSLEIQHRQERLWILSLLEEGLRTSLDFHLCQKRYLFTILLPFYSSSISNEQEKVKILQILVAVAKIYSSARNLCQAGLLTWLHSTIELSDKEQFKLIENLLNTLWTTCSDVKEDAAEMYSSFPTQFRLVQSALSQRQKMIQSQSTQIIECIE